jgi:hypothetical protein
VEDEINLVVCKHDEPKRQADAFYRLLCQYIGWLAIDSGWPLAESSTVWPALRDFLDEPTAAPPDDWTAVAGFASQMFSDVRKDPLCLYWRLGVDEVLILLSDLHSAMTALLHLELLHKLKPKPKHFPDKNGYAFQWTIERILDNCGRPLLQENRFSPQRDAYMLDIIGNTVCADLLDYAGRDSHFANVKLAYDPDRIAENFTLVSWDATKYHPRDDKEGKERREVLSEDPFCCACIRTAISLFTHKLRTDTLGELLNLLNVRLYLYERVIFNPTKCAADAMLGTALQLLGWRPLLQGEDSDTELLPEMLRHVGDAVFLDSIAVAARVILKAVGGGVPEEFITVREALKNGAKSLQVELAAGLADRRCKPTREELGIIDPLDEIRAGLLLLNRLRARRFYRPVFRLLPNAQLPGLDVDAAVLADKIGDAQRRFAVEREIERSMNPPLPVGSIVIHCPEVEPARKVADALVVGPAGGHDMTRKVRHIKDIDGSIFGQHQKATEAITDMYGSIWRLAVYAAPKFVPLSKEIAAVAGRVIVQQLDASNTQTWPNDPNLAREFEIQCKIRQEAGGISVTDIAELVNEALAEVGADDRSLVIDRTALKDVLKRALSAKYVQPPAEKPADMTLELPDEIARALGRRFRDVASQSAIRSWVARNSQYIGPAEKERLLTLVRAAVEYTPAGLLAARKGQSAWSVDDIPKFLDGCLVALRRAEETLDGHAH